MSIASEISRLQTAKAGLKTAIEGKGVTVPSATTLDGYPALVGAIPAGGGYSQKDVLESVYANKQYYRKGLSGDWDVDLNYVEEWAVSNTGIENLKVVTNGSKSGYVLYDRAFSRNMFLKKAYIETTKADQSHIGSYAFQNCPQLERVCFKGKFNSINSNIFNSCSLLTDIYVSWSEGDVAGAPWSATNATVHYNSTFDSDGNPITT